MQAAWNLIPLALQPLYLLEQCQLATHFSHSYITIASMCNDSNEHIWEGYGRLFNFSVLHQISYDRNKAYWFVVKK